MTTSIVLLVLIAAWAGYLFLVWRDGRASSGAHRGDTIAGFNRSLGSLGSPGRSSGPGVAEIASGMLGDVLGRTAELATMPRTVDEAARRRRAVFSVLGTAAAVTFLASLVLGSAALSLHVLIDLALIAYGYAVVRRQHLSAEQEIKVRMLYPDRVETPSEQSVVVPMRRTASG